jgi:acyl carrier protein
MESQMTDVYQRIVALSSKKRALLALRLSRQVDIASVKDTVAGGRRLVAFVVPSRETSPTVNELRRFLKQKLPSYMVPSAFVFLDSMPLTPGGKVDRRALPLPDGTRPDIEESFVAPRTTAEKELAEIWKEVLGIEQVGIYDNFFDLGGHSLLLIQAIDRSEKKFGIRINPGEFMLQNLRQIASVCEREDLPSEVLNPVEENISSGVIKPFYFGTSDKQLFGCYQALQSGFYKECGVILCYPMGEEYIRFHRAYRQLADDLTNKGFPVLRFDFYGCGDSAGDCKEGKIDQWLSDISTAIDEIRQRSGVEKICLVGLRLGGSLAMMAGTERKDIDTLVLLDPVVDGRRYIDELTTWHQDMLRLSHVKANHLSESESLSELLGFSITNSLLTDIENIDLLAVNEKPAKKILFIESYEETKEKTLIEYLKGLDINVEYQHLPDSELWNRSDRFLIEDVSRVQMPYQILNASVSWLSEEYL